MVAAPADKKLIVIHIDAGTGGILRSPQVEHLSSMRWLLLIDSNPESAFVWVEHCQGDINQFNGWQLRHGGQRMPRTLVGGAL